MTETALQRHCREIAISNWHFNKRKRSLLADKYDRAKFIDRATASYMGTVAYRLARNHCGGDSEWTKAFRIAIAKHLQRLARRGRECAAKSAMPTQIDMLVAVVIAEGRTYYSQLALRESPGINSMEAVNELVLLASPNSNTDGW